MDRHPSIARIFSFCNEKLLKNWEIRPMVEYLYRRNGRELVGVEIGVDLAKNSLDILKFLDIKKLYLIDPYEDYIMDCKLEKSGEIQYKCARRTLSKYEGKTQFIRKYSQDAIGEIPDNLDFVYIDGNHDESYVRDDLNSYYQKVKKGGVIGGHDFSAKGIGVCRSVLKFAEDKKLQIQGEWCAVDWWIVKP